MPHLSKFVGPGGEFRIKYTAYVLTKKGYKISPNYLCELLKGTKPLSSARFEIIQGLANLFYNGSIDVLLEKNGYKHK